MSTARRIVAQRIAYAPRDTTIGAAQPLVSVVLPAFNAAAFIERAIESVLGQSYGPIELIVVDDGSGDATPEALARYGDRIRSVRQDRGGVSRARNRGIDLARGPLVAFIDADDEWEPTKIERQVEALRGFPDAVVALTAVRRIGDGRETVVRPRGDGDLMETLLVGSMVLGPPSAMLTTLDALRAAGPFDPSLAQGEDWDLLVRLALLGPFVLLPEPLTRYRIHAGNASGDLERAERDNRRVLDRAFDDPAIASGYAGTRARALSSHHLRFFVRYLASGDPIRSLGSLARAIGCRPSAAIDAVGLVARTVINRSRAGR